MAMQSRHIEIRACQDPSDLAIYSSLAGDHSGVGSHFSSLEGLPSPHLLALHMASFSAMSCVQPYCMCSVHITMREPTRAGWVRQTWAAPELCCGNSSACAALSRNRRGKQRFITSEKTRGSPTPGCIHLLCSAHSL